MKKFKRIFALACALLFALCLIPGLASASEWRSDMRRMNDLSGVLDEAIADELNDRACDAVEECEFDFVLVTYDDVMRAGETDEAYVGFLYDYNEMGWGNTHDGIIFAVNTDEKTFVITTGGRGEVIFSAQDLDDLGQKVRKGYGSGGWAEAFEVFLDSATAQVEYVGMPYLDDTEAEDYYPSTVIGSFEEPAVGRDLPDWYPEDMSTWTWTAAPAEAPRVIDDADLFTDEQEAALSARIAETSYEYLADIVVVTTPSTGGFEHMDYADDYYDYNGFGFGPEHDGFLLLICMDPSHRGGWCTVTGSRPRSYYTESAANALDDVLYEYLGDGEYFDGVYDWVKNIGGLLDKGVPFAPDWFPSANSEYVREHDASAPRIVDEGLFLSASEISALEQKRRAISKKYGVDVLIFTRSTPPAGFGRQEYVDAFYKYNGYGYGQNYDGIVLSLWGSGDAWTNVYGSPSEKLTSRNVGLLDEGVEDLSSNGDYYKAAYRWLSYLDKTLKYGRTPRTPQVWTFRSVVAGIVGLISSAASVGAAKAGMKTVRTAYDANNHLVPGTLNIERLEDRFTHTTVSRIYSPVERSSGGGGGGSSSGGHSSYSGGHSSSSGTSHSGSGRGF